MVFYRLEFNVFTAIIVSRKCEEGVAYMHTLTHTHTHTLMYAFAYMVTVRYTQYDNTTLQIAFIVYIGLCKCMKFLWIVWFGWSYVYMYIASEPKRIHEHSAKFMARKIEQCIWMYWKCIWRSDKSNRDYCSILSSFLSSFKHIKTEWKFD